MDNNCIKNILITNKLYILLLEFTNHQMSEKQAIDD